MRYMGGKCLISNEIRLAPKKNFGGILGKNIGE